MTKDEMREHVEFQFDMHREYYTNRKEIADSISEIENGKPVLEDYIEGLVNNNELAEDDVHIIDDIATEYFLSNLKEMLEEYN